MEKEKEYNNIEKAAVILSSLPEGLASEVLRHLETAEIERLSARMAKMGTVPSNAVDEVIDEFVEMATKGDGAVSLGKGYAENLMSKVFGEEKAKSMLGRIPEGEGYRSLSMLEEIDSKTLTDLTRNEHPQTIALILSHLSPEKAGSVLPALAEELRAEVILRISNLERVPPDVINEVAEMLESEVKSMGGVGHKLGGVKTVADILNQVDRATESSIVAKIEETDPKIADEIRQLMFIFDDLVMVDDRGIQEILKEVSSEDLAKALKTATEPLKDKIFKNMSDRAVEMLNEDIEDMGPIRLSDVEKIQQSITQVAMRLEEEGKITMGGRGGEEVFV
jgi:flagellar motor switch protein FliG